MLPGGSVVAVELGDALVERLLAGDIRKRAIDALQEARGNPELMKQLMEKPDVNKMRDFLRPGTMVAPTAEQAQDVIPEQKAKGGKVDGKKGAIERIIHLLQTDPQQVLDMIEEHREAILGAEPKLKDKLDYIERHARREMAKKGDRK